MPAGRDQIWRSQDHALVAGRPPNRQRLARPSRTLRAALATVHCRAALALALSALTHVAAIDLTGRLAAWGKGQSLPACCRQSRAVAARPAQTGMALDGAGAADAIALHRRIFSRRRVPLPGAW